MVFEVDGLRKMGHSCPDDVDVHRSGGATGEDLGSESVADAVAGTLDDDHQIFDVFALELQRRRRAEFITPIPKPKKRRQSAEAFAEGGREELAEKERAEIELIKKYLPAQLSDDEVAQIVDEVIASTGAESRRDMGKVMGAVIPRIKGRYDASKVKDIVLDKLD